MGLWLNCVETHYDHLTHWVLSVSLEGTSWSLKSDAPETEHHNIHCQPHKEPLYFGPPPYANFALIFECNIMITYFFIPLLMEMVPIRNKQ